MSGNRNRFALTVLAAAISLTACTSSGSGPDASMASAVTFDESWARAADSGMTAVFGTFTNGGDRDAVIVSGESAAANRVELHEVTHNSGGAMMRPKDGGFSVAAGGTKDLLPGGDHLMLIDLTQPLQPGDDVALTVTFADGSALPITAQVRDFAGGDEEYAPGAHHHG
ncbi:MULTISPECIES: copper chaperone PCu(A)C [Mycolicibacterium]|uniref:Uncharacterized conserved protein n=1 Tax=Mycolicibacterium gilvum (strain DSM 45189 / LMG 24558 / Spyr1) TaxID=278137 RepID=E6THF3_MYCSR|nr:MULTISPECIES: copper chaperone PCu(A)C [Mycolicibacterium]ADU00161.1 uncharacterized conserved protein [Mycolicibacterium gilvum Spyr1]MBV5242802.1 copper chaperone PCu(A)C [Mycolicibacterium sp. PAM1]